MTGPVSDAELARLPAKTKKHPEVVALYRQHDFLTAYARHTDLRVRQDGPASAVGAAKDWERHGNLQARFLISQGLMPQHQLLEIGCGTGRLARKVVPYLRPGHYAGIDLSPAAIAAARELSVAEGWDRQSPKFDTRWPQGTFEYLWAFSVTIHLPAEQLRLMMQRARTAMRFSSRFYFSYVPEARDERTGFKQFRHTLETYQRAAADAGLTFDQVSEWEGEQRVAVACVA